MKKAVIVFDGHPTYHDIVIGIGDCLSRSFSEVLVETTPVIDISGSIFYFVVGYDGCTNHTVHLWDQVKSGKPRRAKITLWYLERLPLPNGSSKNAQRNLAKLQQNFPIYDHVFVAEKGMSVFLNNIGLNVDFVPLRFHPCLTHRANPLKSEIDALFVGWQSPRRRNLLHAIAQKTKLYAPSFIWGPAKDNALAQAKVLVNIHYDCYNNLEYLRFLEAMSNDTLIVSETVDYPEPYVPNQHFVMAEPEELPEKVSFFTQNKREREKIVKQASEFIRSQPQLHDSVREILEVTLESSQ